MMITADDIRRHRRSGPWRELLAIARTLITQTRAAGGSSFTPQLGGGTRLMLALEHRISDDIDLFVDSPAWLGYVSPRLNDDIDNRLQAYNESNDSVKLVFPQGEIDFIVATQLLPCQDMLWNPPACETPGFCLQPPAEVLAKKLFFRGWALTARDLFDWWAIESLAPPDEPSQRHLAKLLQSKMETLEHAILRLSRHAVAGSDWQRIRAAHIPELPSVIHWAQDQLKYMATLQQTPARESAAQRKARRAPHNT